MLTGLRNRRRPTLVH